MSRWSEGVAMAEDSKAAENLIMGNVAREGAEQRAAELKTRRGSPILWVF
jgi:hypothetical protein